MSHRSRQLSPNPSMSQDSDGDHNEDYGDDPQPGKPGRKKNPNSQAARRDQNRIAQREFRLRKQQRIRDLEARVEILSGSKDETYEQMRSIVKELVAENQTLRNMVRSLSGFIGDGVGGFLPRMGWSPKEFEEFISRADTDTAYAAFVERKRALETAGGQHHANGRKRARTDSHAPSFEGPGNVSVTTGPGGASPFSASAPVPPAPTYSADNPAMGLYSNMRQSHPGFSPFLQLGDSPGGGGSTASAASGGSFPGRRDIFSASPAFPSGPGGGSAASNGTNLPSFATMAGGASSAHEEEEADPNHAEAGKLIMYHLDNYKRNSAYCLPPSLRPSIVQRTVDHESIIDGVVHPEVRNRMILLRGRFNLAECIAGWITSTVIHGDDVLAHANWEIKESWLKQFGFLVDQPTLAITNRWRKERGDAELTMSDIGGSEQLPNMS